MISECSAVEGTFWRPPALTNTYTAVNDSAKVRRRRAGPQTGFGVVPQLSVERCKRAYLTPRAVGGPSSDSLLCNVAFLVATDIRLISQHPARSPVADRCSLTVLLVCLHGTALEHMLCIDHVTAYGPPLTRPRRLAVDEEGDRRCAPSARQGGLQVNTKRIPGDDK